MEGRKLTCSEVSRRGIKAKLILLVCNDEIASSLFVSNTLARLLLMPDRRMKRADLDMMHVMFNTPANKYIFASLSMS
jgi:hypothetical protein